MLVTCRAAYVCLWIQVPFVLHGIPLMRPDLPCRRFILSSFARVHVVEEYKIIKMNVDERRRFPRPLHLPTVTVKNLCFEHWYHAKIVVSNSRQKNQSKSLRLYDEDFRRVYYHRNYKTTLKASKNCIKWNSKKAVCSLVQKAPLTETYWNWMKIV